MLKVCLRVGSLCQWTAMAHTKPWRTIINPALNQRELSGRTTAGEKGRDGENDERRKFKSVRLKERNSESK